MKAGILTSDVRPLDLDRDLETLHGWVTHPRSVFWGLQGADVDAVRVEYARIVADPHHHAWIGSVAGEPTFLAETYDPAHSELAAHYAVRPGDLGMHVLVAPPTQGAVRGLTTEVFRAVMSFCFRDPSVDRVVVEPDVRNERIAALNARAGFVVEREVALHDKTASLAFCTRDAFAASELGGRVGEGSGVGSLAPRRPRPVTTSAPDPVDLTAHLTPDVMREAHLHVAAKALGELTHERVLQPEPDGDLWVVRTTDERVAYRFHAHRHPLEHWVVAPWSVERVVAGEREPVDARVLVMDLADRLGVPDALLPTYLEEIASTLQGWAWKRTHHALRSRDLVDADFATIEASMSEGHPAFVANNGRIGFGADEYAAYAPETGAPFRLVWLAVRREQASLSLGRGVTEDSLYASQLDADERAGFEAVLRHRGLDPADYLLMPVHPWQWRHKLAITFAPDVAAQDVVPVGESAGTFRAQQSIRTYLSAEHPERHYVKTALSVQNMGFMRGLSPRYMRATPAINDVVADLVDGDPTLKDCGFSVLRELAAIGWTGGVFEQVEGTNPYQKMTAALWRESPVPRTGRGERLATMASLLHRDRDGVSLVSELVAASRLDAAEWVRRYLRAYLRPVVHCLYRWELAFMPHGENVILVLEDHAVGRVFMKDVGEEVVLMGDHPLPEVAERIRQDVPQDLRPLSVLTDVFDGFLRFLAGILDDDGLLPADQFWGLVGDCLREHHAQHLELADVVARYDLFRPTFTHSCLNRLQLRNTLQMVDLADQAGSLAFAGQIENPIGTAR